jgi:hypothetical protein
MSDYSPTPTKWYTAQEAAQEFEKPMEQIEAIYHQAIEHQQTGIAYYHGPNEPMIICAFLIKRFTGKESIV